MTTASKASTVFQTGISQNQDAFQAGKEAATKALGKTGDMRPQLGLVFASSKYGYAEVLKGIRSVCGDTQIFGCSSATEFTEEAVTKDSVVCAFISSNTHKFAIAVGDDLANDPLASVSKAADKLPAPDPDYPHQSMILLLDALSGKGEDVCMAAASVFGSSVRFSGGAAADNLTFDNCAVFCEDKPHKDALAICRVSSKKAVSIGVRHGHLAISPPLTITKAKDNVVHEIDGKPAFEIWKEYTRTRASQKGIDVDNLANASEIGAYLMQYEAGLSVGSDYKVRAPLSVNPDGSINFACLMIEGAVIRIMESPNKACQINSAKEAAAAAFRASKGAKLAGAIVFDCICRNLILDNEFSKAIDEIKGVVGKIPIIGFATYGEIAMEVGQLSGFHNTTTVVLLIPE